MIFPDSPRVKYKKNPLEQVICQLRFPTILRIGSHPPVEFQEGIRQQFPVLHINEESNISVPQEVMQLFPAAMQAAFKRNKTYVFISENESWTLSLNEESIALTTSQYSRWEEFKDYLDGALNLFVEIYKPTFFSRIGLRYRDVIKRSKLGMSNSVSWSELLKSHIAGELAQGPIESAVVEKISHLLIKLDDDIGFVRLQHGIATDEEKENCYLIDSDFFSEDRIRFNDAISLLDKFNSNGRRLFQWCITEKLHDAMAPEAIS
jgi:uncharacterized protein (TIGR04255 family)